jgi:hypothetical protein
MKKASVLQPSALLEYFYKWVMTGITVILLLVVSQVIARPLILRSFVIDLLARIWICLVFCRGYVILSNPRKHMARFYHKKIEDLENVSDHVTGYLIVVPIGFMFGILATAVTWWTLQVFIPILGNVILALSILNGVICFMPIAVKPNRFVY